MTRRVSSVSISYCFPSRSCPGSIPESAPRSPPHSAFKTPVCLQITSSTPPRPVSYFTPQAESASRTPATISSVSQLYHLSSLVWRPRPLLCLPGLRSTAAIAISVCMRSSLVNRRWTMSADLSSQAGQGKLLLLILGSVCGCALRIRSWPTFSTGPFIYLFFLKELTTVAFFNYWCRNIDGDTPMLLV